MTQVWISFAPIEPQWTIPPNLTLPFQFSASISYRAIPEWIWKDWDPDGFRPEVRQKIGGAHECIAVEYEAEALGLKQMDATREIFATHTALWLAHPTPLSFEAMIHAHSDGDEWLTRQIVSYTPVRPLPQYEAARLFVGDFAQAKMLLPKILCLPKHGTVRTAVSAITRARVEGSWELRFLIYWLAVEALFGPLDGREISFRLSQRVAFFLEKERSKAQQVFEQIKDSYGWRSKIVHGLRVSNITGEQIENLLSQLEEFLRCILTAILSDQDVTEKFDGKDREKFLDGLAFK